MKKIFLILLVIISFVTFNSSTLSNKNVSVNTIPKDTITITHNGYKTLWSSTLDYPLMVQWLDTRERIYCNQIERKDQFGPDPKLLKETNIQKEYDSVNKYQKSKGLKGFDRGHMCPADDNKCPIKVNGKLIDSKILQKECFYFTNMAPQYHSLNAGDWEKLEKYTQKMVLAYDSVYVWCGSVGSQFVVDNLHIPTKCWKVIYIKKTKTYEYYIFDNQPSRPLGLEKWKVKKEDVEKLTGFKFIFK
jgi:endonuclease G